MIAAPEPGIYPGVEPEVYFSWDAINNSGLSDFARSPARFRWVQEHPEKNKQTKSTRFGSYIHCAILEPEELEKRFVHCPGPWNRQPFKSGKDAAVAMDLTPLHTDDWEAADRIRDNVRAHPEISDFRSLATEMEVSCVWLYDGHPVKQRIDLLARSVSLAGDIKTTRSVERFAHDAGELGYFRQNAIYSRGLAELGIPCKVFYFILVESTPPYEVALKILDEFSVSKAFEEFEHLAARMIECRETAKWQGHPTGIETIYMKPYHLHEIERRLER